MASKSNTGAGSSSGRTDVGSSSGKTDAGSSSGKIRVGKYEIGKTLGWGTFAKVKFATNVETGQEVAIKVINKAKVLQHKMVEQIKREISTMRLVRHPNVVRIYEVIASKTKIYIVMELLTGGELYEKLAAKGRLNENEARKYFQQLIDGIDYCHSRGVYHRDLKPENLLLDDHDVLKVTDFGLSALSQHVREDGLLHTTCGTAHYIAPEVINNKGYDGAKADLWSCGVILYVIMCGYLPFEDPNLAKLCTKIVNADFALPIYFSTRAKRLISRILDPNPSTRITIEELRENDWFKKEYKPPTFEPEDSPLDDIDAIFNESLDSPKPEAVEKQEQQLPTSPATLNAFEIFALSQGLNLGALFERHMGIVKRETRFISKHPANEIMTRIEQAAAHLGFSMRKKNFKMKLRAENPGRMGHLSVVTEIFELAPQYHMIELRKTEGDTLEFHKFYKDLSIELKDIIWTTDKASSGSSKSKGKGKASS